MKIKIIILLFILFVFPFTTLTFADDSTTSSIVGDYFNKVFDIELSDGRTFIETNTDIEKREEINNQIYDGTIQENYSLYDRFGGLINFIPYFGEKKISTNLLDRFYTQIVNGTEYDFKLRAKEIISMLTSNSAISNNVVYEGRPNVLSDESIEAGHQDPRVSTYSGISSVGGSAALGNLMLYISNIITTVVGWLSGSGIYNTINDIWIQLCNSEFIKYIQLIVQYLLPVAITIFIFYIYSMSMKYIKGNISGKKIGTNLLSICISLGLIFSLMNNPTSFSSILTNLVTSFDQTLDLVISSNSSEVVKSDNLDNVRIAKLWEKNIFYPWCNGMFGYDYNELYTQYDTDKNHIKMKQSHDDVKTVWNDGSIKYDSASLTGDISIQIGPNEYVRNWAALAWSAQSIYHIDSVKNDDTNKNDALQENQDNNKNAWPKATTTPMNNQIYVDNFRWLDAKLNISPEYYSPDKVIMDYSSSNNYSQSFISSGFYSLYLSMLLIPIMILVFRKLTNALFIITSGVRLLYKSIYNFVVPEKYDVISNIQKTIQPIYDFFWWSVVIFLAINTYSKLVGNNVMSDFIWIIIGTWLCKFKPVRTTRELRSLISKFKHTSKNISNNMISGINKKFNWN